MKKKISENFTWEELTYSRVAIEKGLQNEPTDEVRLALEELVKRLLQPLRIAFGGPIAITSGYRCPQLNRIVGGVPSSQHVKGEAVDCYVPDAAALLEVLKNNTFPFDQAILYRKKNFLHLSLRRNAANRRQIFEK